jgi:peptidoglycan/LPS O-acetylase OafA/YrhL
MIKRNLEIERLRAVALIMVFLSHLPFRALFLNRFFYNSHTGVDLFFVISGYVVASSLLKSLPVFDSNSSFDERLRLSFVAVKIFFVKRIFRIFPSALFWMFFFLLGSVVMNHIGVVNPEFKSFGEPENVVREIICILTGSYNYALWFGGLSNNLRHFWSLCIEEHFYLFLPFFLIWFSSRGSRIGASILAILGTAFIIRPLSGVNYSQLSHCRFDQLLMGVLLWLLGDTLNRSKIGLFDFEFYTRGDKPLLANSIASVFSNYWIRTLLKTIFSSLFVILMILLPSATNQAIWGQIKSADFYDTMGYLPVGLIAVVLVFLASLEKGFIFDIPILRGILNYIGSRSYSLYLSHWFFITLWNCSLLNFDAFPVIVTIVLLSILASEITYRYVEAPFIKFGKSIAQAVKFSSVV